MTDKVQKIREEVEKLNVKLLRGACSSQIAMETRCKEEAYNEVLAILDSLQEEPKKCMYTKDHYTDEDRKVLCDGCEEECEFNKKEPVSEDLEKEIDHAHKLFYEEVGWDSDEGARAYVADWFAYYFAKWQKENLWKPADGDDLPILDREVIALLDNGKVVFAHRPPEYWDGKDIVTGKVTRHYPKTYDKGGWNIPNIKYWLDCLLPNMEED